MSKSLSLAFYLATRARSDRGPDSANGKTPERLGQISENRPEGPLIWFHTGQDRQADSVREFARRLCAEREDLTILLTTGAPDRRASEPHVISQFAPDESLSAVRRFLTHWRPDIAIWTEPDLRPALITQTDDTGAPLFLIDAHTARPDPQAWRWRRGMSASLLGRFQRIAPFGRKPRHHRGFRLPGGRHSRADLQRGRAQ